MGERFMNDYIPKIIHYCWFGGVPLPSLAQKCIASWKKFLSDYEIKEWNENNFDIHCCRYVEEAYKTKKWAFVSDYARFRILYEHGGLYFDTDVEIIKPLDDILARGGFMGVERYADKPLLNPGLGLAVAPGLGLYKELYTAYHSRKFINEDGSMNLKTVVLYTTECLAARGLTDSHEIQCIDGVYIYPKDYFNPCNMNTGKIEITQNTVSIHHFAASWVDRDSHIRWKIYQILYRFFGRKIANGVRSIFGRHAR